jgi:hypothetical protein
MQEAFKPPARWAKYQRVVNTKTSKLSGALGTVSCTLHAIASSQTFDKHLWGKSVGCWIDMRLALKTLS